jgi:hypothetical protein
MVKRRAYERACEENRRAVKARLWEKQARAHACLYNEQARMGVRLWVVKLCL